MDKNKLQGWIVSETIGFSISNPGSCKRLMPPPNFNLGLLEKMIDRFKCYFEEHDILNKYGAFDEK